MNLLLVEDDVRIAEFLVRGLRAEGHIVDPVRDGANGLDKARQGQWDAIILDLMLPGMDGREGGREIAMTSLEYALLEFLMVEAGKVVSRARILQNVWGAHQDPLTNVVDVYIRRLRSKIDDGFATKLINTIRGRGYRLGQR